MQPTTTYAYDPMILFLICTPPPITWWCPPPEKTSAVSTKIIPKIKSDLPKHQGSWWTWVTLRQPLPLDNCPTKVLVWHVWSSPFGEIFDTVEGAFHKRFTQKIWEAAVHLSRHIGQCFSWNKACRSDFEVSKIATPAALGNAHSFCEFPTHLKTASINRVRFFWGEGGGGGVCRENIHEKLPVNSSTIVEHLDVKPLHGRTSRYQPAESNTVYFGTSE